MDYKKVLEDHRDIVDIIKKNIENRYDGIARHMAVDIKKNLGIKDSDIDFYYRLRTEMFDLGIVVERGEHKSGAMILEFRTVGEYDIKPISREEEEKTNTEWFKELEEELPGLSEIAKMENFNDFDPDKVIDILEGNSDVIEKVRSITDTKIGVTFKKDAKGDDLICAMVEMVNGSYGLEADSIDYLNGEVTFWWD